MDSLSDGVDLRLPRTQSSRLDSIFIQINHAGILMQFGSPCINFLYLIVMHVESGLVLLHTLHGEIIVEDRSEILGLDFPPVVLLKRRCRA